MSARQLEESDPLAERAFSDAIRDIFEAEGRVELLLDSRAADLDADGRAHGAA